MKNHSPCLPTRILSVIIYVCLISCPGCSSPTIDVVKNTLPGNAGILSVPFVWVFLAFSFLLLIAMLQYLKLRTTLRELRNVKTINENAVHLNKLMTSVLSHEIRSPLGSIHFIISSLLDHIKGNDGNIRPEDIILLEELNGSFQATEESTENYLVWCEVNTTQIDFKRKRLLLNQIVNEQVKSLGGDIIKQSHRMMVHAGTDLSINSDPKLIKIMIRNLFFLATQGRNKQIEVKLSKEDENAIHLTMEYSAHPLSKTYLTLNAAFNDNVHYKPETPGEIGIALIASLCRLLGYKVQYSHHADKEVFVIIFAD
jgi:signal transduction histidine kinase